MHAHAEWVARRSGGTDTAGVADRRAVAGDRAAVRRRGRAAAPRPLPGRAHARAPRARSGSGSCSGARDDVALSAPHRRPGRAVVRAGLEAIYLSGWQVAADANLGGQIYPDQSLYPANSVPAVVRRHQQRAATRRPDRLAEGQRRRDWIAPIVADAEAGFGGPLNAYELMRGMIEAGAAGVHFEDQLASEKKCGHLGGKVLVPTSQFVRTLIAARLAADVAGVPTVLVARTDALSAEADHERRRRARRRVPHRRAHARGLLPRHAAASNAADRARPRLRALRRPALVRDLDAGPGRGAPLRRGDPRRVPGKLLAYNCSPSFNWRRHLDDDDDRALPAGARRDGLQVPVHHAGRVPRAQPVACSSSPGATLREA